MSQSREKASESLLKALAAEKEFDDLIGDYDESELDQLAENIDSGVLPQKNIVVVEPPKPVKVSGILNRSRQSANLYASYVSEKTAVAGETHLDPKKFFVDEVIKDVMDLLDSANKGQLAGGDLSTPPKYIIILVDNSERALGFSRNGAAAREKYLYDIINTIQAKGKEKSKKDPNDKRHSKIFVCLREIMHNHRVNLGLNGMFATHKNQLMKVPHYMDFEVAIIMNALKSSGITSASFDCSDMIFLDEVGKARKFIEHKTFPDLRSCSFGDRAEEWKTQRKKLYALFEKLGVPVEIVVSGQCSINDTAQAKALVNQIRTSNMPWFFTFDTDALAYFVMHTALHLMDPNERYSRAEFLRSDVMSRVHDIKDITPLDTLKASLVTIKGVSVEIATAFINHGLTSIVKLTDYGRAHGKDAFANLKTKGGEDTEGRRIGIKGEEIYRALGLEEDSGGAVPKPPPANVKKAATRRPTKADLRRKSGAHTSDEEERYTGPPLNNSARQQKPAPSSVPSSASKRKLESFSAATLNPKGKKSRVDSSNFVAKKTVVVAANGRTKDEIMFTSDEESETEAEVQIVRDEDDDHTTDGGDEEEEEEEEEPLKMKRPEKIVAPVPAKSRISIPVPKKAVVHKVDDDL